MRVAAQLIKEDGFLSLYSGFSAGIVRQLSYGMARLGLFRTLTNRFTPEGKTASDIHWTTMLGCSLTAGGLGALIGTPADAALVRMQADTMLPVEQRRGYKHVFDALYQMAKYEGVSGFFSGATPTILRAMSLNVGMFMTFDSLKAFNKPYLGDGQANRFISGFESGVVAATVCLPFDFLKTRLQKQKRLPDGTYPYKNVLDAARKISAKEGPGALVQGYPTFLVRIVPHIMITWVVMDNVNAALKENNM